jgi:hypothetical protein
MSLIHWDKSVLSFHLKEIIEDGHGSHPLALAGLGAIALTSLVLPAVTKLGKPVLKTAIKSSLSLEPGSTTSPGKTSELIQLWEQAALTAQATRQDASQNNHLDAKAKQLIY